MTRSTQPGSLMRSQNRLSAYLGKKHPRLMEQKDQLYYARRLFQTQGAPTTNSTAASGPRFTGDDQLGGPATATVSENGDYIYGRKRLRRGRSRDQPSRPGRMKDARGR